MFRPVSSQVSFPAQEAEILRFWEERDIFARSLQERPQDKLFVMYEGPPTANASPGIHHVLSRAFKDIIPRYKTMKGYRAPRKAGWDTHGLPVELEVEKELGFKSKPDIEAYGVENFNQKCRESVMRYVKEWEALTRRIGFWLDMEHPYRTFDNDYIESCWWIVKQLWDKGLLRQDYRVTPHCPRCVTSLSDHEVALGYEDDVEDPSIYIRFRLNPHLQPDMLATTMTALKRMGWDRQKAEWTGEIPSLLAWTTTPWTLTANLALAVAPDADYVLVQTTSGGVSEWLILAEALLDKALGSGNWRILERFQGSDLTGIYYQRLYEPPVSGPKLPTYGNRVVIADFVSLEEGTGIVHIAPAYGAEDFELRKAADLELVHTVDLEGKMLPSGKKWDGKFVKEADPEILEDLILHNLLFRRGVIRHTYPFCWRCHTPLLYYAKPSWYICTTEKKDRLIEGNQEVNWYPEHIQEGRFGEWLRNNVDWAVSRERYWGTPLPVWRCQGCGKEECIGSRQELKAKAGLQGWEDALDLHRPYIDKVTFSCPQCGGTMRRLLDVLDAWFDSGAMPYAQWHYPFENEGEFKQSFPADYICEAVDQTRGWFYTLHALSTLLFDKPSFENVICLGHILDSKGEKMSKSRGNVVGPGPVLDKHGADALRWYLFTASPPGNPRRFSGDLVAEAVRRFLLPLWNTYSFFVTYANIDKFDPRAAPQVRPTSDLDRWIISELNLVTAEVDERLSDYDPTGAARRLEAFVEDLSHWYVRRSRRRFWKSENDADKLSAYATLYHCLVTLSHLLAPFTPFLAESMYRNLVPPFDPAAPESVHLATFPQADPSLIDEKLTEATRLAMKFSSLGRAARSKAGLKVRQPLARAFVQLRAPDEAAALSPLIPQLLDELNIKELCFLPDDSQVVERRLTPSLSILGPKYGKALPQALSALKGLNPDAAGHALEMGGEVEAWGYRFSGEEVTVEVSARPGYALAREGPYLVAVETAVPPELKAEGLAREVVHLLQGLRKEAGFDIADYIVTYFSAEEALRRVIQEHAGYIKQETLSRELVEGLPPPQAHVQGHRIDGHSVTLAVRRA